MIGWKFNDVDFDTRRFIRAVPFWRRFVGFLDDSLSLPFLFLADVCISNEEKKPMKSIIPNCFKPFYLTLRRFRFLLLLLFPRCVPLLLPRCVLLLFPRCALLLFPRCELRGNLRLLTMVDLRRRVVCTEPFSANRFSRLRLLAIRYWIRFMYRTPVRPRT